MPQLASIFIVAYAVTIALFISSSDAKALFGLSVDSFTDVVSDSRKIYCYEKFGVSAAKTCQKVVRLYLLGGVYRPTGNSQLNSSDVKLAQTAVSLSNLPIEASMTIDGALPTSFTLVAELYQTTEAANGDATLLGRFAFSRSLSLSDDWLQVGSTILTNASVNSASALRLALRYRVRCSHRFYGPTCHIYCEPRDDPLGHYTCLPNGERQCLPGWSAPNEYCNKPLCPGCHEKGGKCEAPNRCSCQVGWHGVNCSECQPYAGCAHGYCVEPNECRCNSGWVGRFCKHEQAACSKSPCQNGATCIDNPDVENATRFECECAHGFVGTRCETRVSSIQPNSTVAVATASTALARDQPCRSDDSSCVPHQQASASADFVQQPPSARRSHPCSPSPCLNGATCVNVVPLPTPTATPTPPQSDRFMCVCRQGYTGTRCEMLDFDQHLCQMQKNCVDPTRCYVRSSFDGLPQCACTGDFVGPSCEIVNCGRKPCLNGGVCGLDDGLCRCKPGFNGSHCEVESNRCLPNPCAHGICDQVGGNPFCDCYAGWTGETCNISLFGNRFDEMPGAFAIAVAAQPTTPVQAIISPALFWAVISICVILIVVLLVITKFLVSGIRNKRMFPSNSSPQLRVADEANGQFVQTTIDDDRRLHVHLARHPINNLNEHDELSVICVKKLQPDVDPVEVDTDTDADACLKLLLNASPGSSSCGSKFNTNNFFNPNLNSEKVLPAKHILSYPSKAELQNHTNAARISSAPVASPSPSNSPLPVRCPSPPNWNAHPSTITTAVHSVTSTSRSGLATMTVGRQSLPNAYDLSASYYRDTVAEASAYRAAGNNTLR